MACIASAVGAGRAAGEVGAGATPTSQAVAADAQFLEYAPPPPQPGVVCLVDSGVDPNPDTTPALVGAEGEDPSWGSGDGLAQTQQLVDGHPNGHGTEMAMIMAAPQNGWGMVGIAPTSVRVYSIRVVPPGGTTFAVSSYSLAISTCLKLRSSTQPALTVVNLSLGGSGAPPSDAVSQIGESVEAAVARGVDVVAAAGNDGSVSFPASYPPVIAVGADDSGANTLGVRCGFSPGDGVDISAPGCNGLTGGVDEVFQDDGSPAVGFGTSQAAAIVSAALAAMRAYAPALGVPQAEACLTSTEVAGEIAVARAFEACGLANIVREGESGLQAAPAAPIGAAAPTSDAAQMSRPTAARLNRPRLNSVLWAHGTLSVSVLSKPVGVWLELKVRAKRNGRVAVVASRTKPAATITLRVRSPQWISVRYVVPGGTARPSEWVSKAIR